ncbi:ComEA family DNA-binding protein [Streptomyces sp. ISL-98]|nr:ComEA family DNA-binding protein [Streptomyces sp. ISL-98]MBT2505176.1 ComEA family DNA-binding protein [Streptomyces sp. ISL-98]
MALRSRSRSRSATSGPGRAPASDVRARDGHGRRRRLRNHGHDTAAPTALRRRAEALLAPAPRAAPRSPGMLHGPPAPERLREEPRRPAAPVSPTGPDRVDAGEAEAALGAGAVGQRGFGAVRERLPVWVQARCGLELSTLAALAVVLVVAAGFAAQHFWVGRPQTVQPPEVVAGSPAVPEPDPSPGRPPTASAGGPGGETDGRIVVDVSGKVRQPGIHRLPTGSRVADALRAAGGIKDGTDTAGLNRARVLTDGEQVVVGIPAPAPAATGPAGGGSAPAAGPVSLNSATAEQLETLPGVGPVLAQHILDYRAEHSGFRSIDELREVNGIGDRRFADLQSLVRP